MPNEGQNIEEKKTPLDPSIYSCCGDRIQPIYKRVYNADMKREIVEHVDDFDIYESIQESDNTSDITLLKKMINGGTTEAPEDPLALYGLDLANMPKNIHEVYDTVNHGNEAFEAMGDSYKKAFGSVEGLRQALLDGTASDIIKATYQKDLEAAQKAAIAAADAAKGDNK